MGTGEEGAPAAAGEGDGDGDGEASEALVAWLPGMRAPDSNLTPSPSTVRTAVRLATTSPVIMHCPAGRKDGKLLPCAGSRQPPDWEVGQNAKYSHAEFCWHAVAHSSTVVTLELPN